MGAARLFFHGCEVSAAGDGRSIGDRSLLSGESPARSKAAAGVRYAAAIAAAESLKPARGS